MPAGIPTTAAASVGVEPGSVLGGGEQGDLVVGGDITQVLHGRPVIGVLQFADVAIPELREALLVVVVPVAQVRPLTTGNAAWAGPPAAVPPTRCCPGDFPGCDVSAGRRPE